VRWAAALSAAALALCSCAEKKGPREDPQVVAVVNGQPIGRADFEKELSREMATLDGSPRSPEQAEPFKRTLLDTLIDRALLLQAAHEARVTVSGEEVERRLLALAAEYPDGLDGLIKGAQTTRPEISQRTLEQMTIEKLYAQQVDARLAVSEEAIRSWFDQHPEEFTEGESVHAAQIVVKGLDDAKRIQQQLWAGKKFPDLARRYSLSPEAKVGGDLGFFKRGTMPPAFDEVVFTLPVNQVSEVISTEFGFHLFKVLEKRPPRKKELPEARSQIEKRLLDAARREAQAAFVKGLRDKASLTLNQTALEQVTGRTCEAPP
jgi:peptidyl-prolyl cis-trans isomerase C/foldase protein PrsA